MGMIRRLRAKWSARRHDLAFQQIEADRAVGELPSPATDGVTGMYYEGHRALGGFLNPKAKTKTEWKGD